MLGMIALLFFLLPWAYVAFMILREEANQDMHRGLVFVAVLGNIALVVAYVGFIVGFWFGTNEVKY